MSRQMQLKRLKKFRKQFITKRERHLMYPPRKYLRFGYFFYASPLSAAAEETPFLHTPLGRI